MRKAKNIEWSAFQKLIVFLVVMIILSIGLGVGGFYYQGEMDAKVVEMRQRIKALGDKKRTMDEQMRLLGQLRPRFEGYRAKGVFDPEEPRIKWRESVLQTVALLKPPTRVDVNDVKLDVLKPFVPTFPVKKGSYALFASAMEVKFSLLHEGDLLHFFKLLAQHGYGVYDVRSCTIKRAKEVVEPDTAPRVAVHLKAECKINWYTMQESKGDERGGGKGKGPL